MKKSFIKLLTIMLFASAPIAHIHAMEEIPAQEAQEKKADPMMQDPVFVAIMKAAKKNNLEPLRELLRAGAVGNHFFEFPDDGRVPVIAFVISILDINKNSKMIKEMVDLLIEYGADVNAIDPRGLTPLMLAASKGAVDIAMLLTMHGAGEAIDAKAAGHHGTSALALAGEAGHLEVVELLIKLGAQIDIQNDGGITPLMGASAAGHLDVVKRLVQLGASVNAQILNSPDARVNNTTALMIAAEMGHANVVEFLLNSDALVDVQNGQGSTALMMAAANGHLESVHSLLRHRAQVNLQAAANNNSSALFLAVNRGHIQVVQALLQADAEIDLAPTTGVTPLIAAANKGHKEIVELLLKNGATVNAQAAGASNRTALRQAVDLNHVEIVDLLIEYGADVDLPMDNGITPLMVAADDQKIELLELLLSNNAKIDAQAPDANNMSALMFATLHGREDSVCALLDANADISLRNSDHGDTALCIGARHGYQPIVHRFLTHVPVRDCESIRNCFTGLLALNRICCEADEYIENPEPAPLELPMLPLEMRQAIAIQLFKSLVDDQMPRVTGLLALRNNNNQTAGEVALNEAAALRAEAINLNAPDQQEERDEQEALAQAYDGIAHLLDVNNPAMCLERRKILWNEIVGILFANPESEAGSELGYEEGQNSEGDLDSEEELGSD